jgi:hypothetical protein
MDESNMAAPFATIFIARVFHVVSSRNADSVPSVTPAVFDGLGSYSVTLVRKRNIPTERPPLVGEVSANICG